jgi:hypothetical protein
LASYTWRIEAFSTSGCDRLRGLSEDIEGEEMRGGTWGILAGILGEKQERQV